MKRWIKRIAVLVVLLGCAGVALAWYFNRGEAAQVGYRTAEITRGNLLVTIGSTGTVEPEEVVNVGAQVAGQILTFGTDSSGKTVDYGSVVDANAVLATIDDALYAAEAASADAQVMQAKATIKRSQADLEQMKAKLLLAQQDWDRAQKLGPSEALAQAQFDSYKAAFETAKASIDIGEAAIAQAKAQLVQAQAVQTRAQRNLGFTVIKSPVRGTIIDRRVNIGQTVVASLNAPSLFLIAKDLRRMEVWVAVNEADIGRIRPGMPVSFTVDAFPGETFRGEVGKIRLNASMTQNVVTYTVEVVTDNSSGRLLPYLTANMQFELDHRENVLLAPNAALRWHPLPQQIAPEFREKYANASARAGRGGGMNGATTRGEGRGGATTRTDGNTHRRGEAGEGPRTGGRPRAERGGAGPATAPGHDRDANASPAAAAGGEATTQPTSRKGEHKRGDGMDVLWVRENEFVKPIPVRAGLSDGTNTEVSGQDLAEGLEVVTGVLSPSAAESAEASNPFAPKFPWSRSGRPTSGAGSSGSGSSRSGGQGGGTGRPAGGPPPR